MTSSPAVRKALEFLRVCNQLERAPGFGHAIGFSSLHLHPGQIQFNGGQNEDPANKRKTLRIRLPLTESLLWKDFQGSQKISSKAGPVGLLSTFGAMMDEATTLALVLSDPVRGRPGVSVHLSMEAGPALQRLAVGDDIEIVSVAQRIGRNLGFTKAEVRLLPTGQLVCHGSHTKFLDSLGALGNFFVSSNGFPVLRAYCDLVLKKDIRPTQLTLAELFASLDSDIGESTATFTATPALSSMGGPLHGGAQAILMERAVESILNAQRDGDYTLQSLQIEYLSRPTLQPQVKIIQTATSSDHDMVVVCAEIWSRGKLSSTGLFRYSKVPSKL